MLITTACQQQPKEPRISFLALEDQQRVDVLIDGDMFTSYLYTDTIPVLKKPVLFPLQSAGGAEVTRGYPINPRPGERVDHPHQIGFWFNYGNVNGLDFWNNSDAVPEERAKEMGTIRHRDLKTMKGGDDRGILEVIMEWQTHEGKTLLQEETRFVFQADEHSRTIDRITRLTAQDERVIMEDDKEGMIAVRVARELEHPTESAVRLTGEDGRPMEETVVENTGVNGLYRNSEGISGEDVWAERAAWLSLAGTIGQETVTLAMFDHPENPGYPTYWHARGYGLFSANPLGQKEFSEGEEELNFTIEAGETATFRHRLYIHSDETGNEHLQNRYDEFLNDINRE